MDLWEKEEMEKEHRLMNYIKKHRIDRKKYTSILGKILYQQLSNLDMPPGFTINVRIDDNGGIWALFKGEHNSHWHYRAFKPCGEPLKDYTLMKDIIFNADVAMIKMSQKKQTDAGVYLP